MSMKATGYESAAEFFECDPNQQNLIEFLIRLWPVETYVEKKSPVQVISKHNLKKGSSPYVPPY